jgi:endonuclease/exonuclease/phosphatase family metal-dependent hydrolase
LDAKALAEFIAEVQPNVVALQGWSDVNQAALFQGSGWNVHREGELLVASRFPIASVAPVDLTDSEGTPAGERGAAGVFELTSPSGPVYLLNMHLASPHAGLISFGVDKGSKLTGNIERRWRESDIVRGAAERVPGPLLLAGDFNTTDDSPIFRENWAEYTDAFSERGAGLGYTYLINLTQLRIDHILADSSWKVERCWVGPKVGSPHRPLIADLNTR